MSSEIVFNCDICRESPYPDYHGLSGRIYGIQGQKTSEDGKIAIKIQPSEDDKIHLCHACLSKLSDKFITEFK